MFKKIGYLVIIGSSLFIYSCKQSSRSKLEISCTYKNADNLFPAKNGKVYLEEIASGKDQQPVVLDSQKLTSNNGEFTLTAKIKNTDQEIFELVFGDNVSAIPVVNDVSEIHVDVDLAKKDNFYTITGSEASSQLQTLIDNIGKKNFVVEKSFSQLDSALPFSNWAGFGCACLSALRGKQKKSTSSIYFYTKYFLQHYSRQTCKLGIV